MDIRGKVAVVTGASSGIGQATAVQLARAGAKVALGARRTDRLGAVVDEIGAAGGTALAVEADVRDEHSARALIGRAVRELGGVDILINNAGVMLHSRIERNRSDEWRQMIETNVLGMLYCSGEAVPAMEQRGGGHIVNISSVAGRKTRIRSGVYSATKFGVGALSEALRQEVLDRAIRVTVIEPGAVATELASHITDEEALQAQQASFGSLEPLQPEDIADAILWAVTRPPRVNVNEILIRPTQQEY